MRCLLYTNAASIDLSRHHGEPAVRSHHQELVELLTPVSKAWCTDLGVELTSLAVQVHGGMGYIEETGVAQHFRDSRIAPIYEGTNGIQAIDLVVRKLPMGGGDVARALLRPHRRAGCARWWKRARRWPPSGPTFRRDGWRSERQVNGCWGDWQTAPNDALAGATAYLRMFGLVVGGWLMGRSALAAHRLLAGGDGDKAFLAEKIATAHFYASQLLPQAAGLLPAATAGASVLYDVDLSGATPG